MTILLRWCLLLPCVLSTQAFEDETAARPNEFKKWRQETPPKMIVFSDSNADTGRRFNAPASFDFADIGPFPWKRLYDGPESDSKTAAFMPQEGSPTNGKNWPMWLRIPDEHNFATSSASASDAFRSLERCTGYLAEGEKLPTATLEEQIDRYLQEVAGKTTETLEYTHVIYIGTNELSRVVGAIDRYSLGGEGYQDPVDFDKVFEVDPVTGTPMLDDAGLPVPTFQPMIEEVLNAWSTGVARLIAAGVTGRILLANVGSPKGLPAFFGTPNGASLDFVAKNLQTGAQGISDEFPQVRVLDVYTLFANAVDQPSIFEDLGFSAGENGLLLDPCTEFNFFVDDTAEIMGTQADRHPHCREECALCADDTTPCQSCLKVNPAIIKCDDPASKIFYDALHFTTDFHHIFGEAIRQCSKDSPSYGRPWVEVLCPSGEAEEMV